MRIALISMSATRVINPEIHKLWKTLAGLHERWTAITALPNLGLLTVAGMTPGEHEYAYFELEDIDEFDYSQSFDLAAISCYSAQIFEAYKLSERLRARGVRTVMGGPHVSVLPEEAAEHCDAVVIGQGEVSWPQLLADCEADQLKPFYGELRAKFDLEQLPVPAYDLLDVSKYRRITVETSRGCPLNCEFCATSTLMMEKYRQKSGEKVLADIDYLKTFKKRPFIEFADDNTFVRRRYWRELLPELAKRKVRWFAEADLRVGEDKDLLRQMRDSGCAQLLIGLESPTAEGLDGVELNTNWKMKQFKNYKERIRTIQSHGITVNGCFVVGFDNHTPQVFEDIYNFVEETELFEVQVTVLTPFPGTQLYERLKREGRILEDKAWHKCTLYDVNFQPKHMSPSELQDGFFDLMQRVHANDFTNWRRNCFKKHWKADYARKRAAVTTA